MPLTLRQDKGSALTIQEIDGNFTYLSESIATSTPTTASYALTSSVATQLDGVQITIVNISSAQILACDVTPIEILPSSGADKWYEFESITLEYTHVTTGYTATSFVLADDTLSSYWNKEIYNFTNEGANTVVHITGQMDAWATGSSAVAFQAGYVILNGGLYLRPTNGTVTLGDGTIRAIVTYRTRTFGA